MGPAHPCLLTHQIKGFLYTHMQPKYLSKHYFGEAKAKCVITN